jgi:hypothetical protein
MGLGAMGLNAMGLKFLVRLNAMGLNESSFFAFNLV